MTARPAYIYVMARVDGIRKVGRTVNLEYRRYQHVRDTGIPHELEHAWGMSERSTMLVESIAHKMLKEWRVTDGLARELYSAPLPSIKAIVDKAKKRVEKSFSINLMEYDWDGERGGPIMAADGEPLSAIDPLGLLEKMHEVGELGSSGLTYENNNFIYREYSGVGDGHIVPRRKIEKLVRRLGRRV